MHRKLYSGLSIEGWRARESVQMTPVHRVGGQYVMARCCKEGIFANKSVNSQSESK